MPKAVLTAKEIAKQTTAAVSRENKKGNIMPHVGRLKRGFFKELDEKGSTASKSGQEASERISSAPFLQRWRKNQGKGGKTRKRKRRRKRKTRKRKRKKSRKKRKRRKRRKTRR